MPLHRKDVAHPTHELQGLYIKKDYKKKPITTRIIYKKGLDRSYARF